jgi:CBS-domain-containing membrane protein
MTQQSRNDKEGLPGNNLTELPLSDEDILDAMRHIPGYLDISTEDFRAIYRLAHRHAIESLFSGMTASRLMRKIEQPLTPDMPLDLAARTLANSGYKGLPVVDAGGIVIGMLTETDFLRCLKVSSFLELSLKLSEDSFEFTHHCHGMPVSTTMTQPAVTVGPDAEFMEVMKSFGGHQGRSMPVAGADGRLLGLLLRKDFLRPFI